MTLFSQEAKWVALLEALKEVMFVIQLLRSIKFLVKLPVMVRVNNVGVIFWKEILLLQVALSICKSGISMSTNIRTTE